MSKRADQPKEIAGNTLRVYVYLLTHGPSELREVQRALGFSTPSLAAYHLSKLVKAGYATQDSDGRYLANPEATPTILEEYSRLGTRLVPNMLFFAVLFTILASYFSYRALTTANTYYVELLAATATAMCAVLWYQAARAWRKLVGLR